MNSVQQKYYLAYYMPEGYGFQDVIRSIKLAKKLGGFVSINYLVMPGFSDYRKEVESLLRFLERTKVDMVQWRNLNYDPMVYFRTLKLKQNRSDMIGIKELIRKVKKERPDLMQGYFNPSKRRMQKAKKKR